LEKSQSHDDEDIEKTIKTFIKGENEVKGVFTKKKITTASVTKPEPLSLKTQTLE
jgi:hypothetical protein